MADPADVVCYEQVLAPWPAGDVNQVVRISPQLVNGYELVADS
ncbi:hypothetical protein [Lentzea nigeriaca]|nr:hypothetical protein [Lentzea nigeriaca]MBM7859046.1 hypothetical protein [Lentzea nigeriaca]